MQQISDEQLTANNRLAELKKSITAADKKKAVNDLGFNRITVSKYLNGKGTELDTAMKLLKFFNACVAKKRKVLAAI